MYLYIKIMYMAEDRNKLVKILQLSHSQILAGKSCSQEETERYLDQRPSYISLHTSTLSHHTSAPNH